MFRSNGCHRATVVQGFRPLREGFPRLGDDSDAMERSVIGIILVRFERTISIIHVFGHGFARRYAVQQGLFHAALAPHVLRYLLDNVDARRRLLADGLDIDWAAMADDELTETIVHAVVALETA